MKNERIKRLRSELKYLLEAEIEKEILENDIRLGDEAVRVADIAKDIYLKRGIDIKKLNKSFLGNLVDSITEMANLFKHKDKATKIKMIIDIVYIIVLLLLIKIPFDLVRDIGYQYIEILSTQTIYYNLWSLLFLLLYTITILCSFIVFVRNFNNKYKDTNSN